MKRIALLSGVFVSMIGAAFADIAVGPNPADFIPVIANDPAATMLIVVIPVVILVAAAIIILWHLKHQKVPAGSIAKSDVDKSALTPKEK